MDWKLELVSVPVSDVDRAKSFYVDQVGFNLDHDHVVNESLRFIQLTPHGSACSITIGLGITDAVPGSLKGLQLVVSDIEAAHAELVDRGVEVSDVQDYEADLVDVERLGSIDIGNRHGNEFELPVHGDASSDDDGTTSSCLSD